VAELLPAPAEIRQAGKAGLGNETDSEKTMVTNRRGAGAAAWEGRRKRGEVQFRFEGIGPEDPTWERDVSDRVFVPLAGALVHGFRCSGPWVDAARHKRYEMATGGAP